MVEPPERLRAHHRDEQGLRVGAVAVRDLLETYGSPLFVVNGEVVDLACRRIQATLGEAGARLYLAGKANPNPAVWLHLKTHGIGLDACSPGEVEQALAAGFEPAEVSFTGCALTASEMQYLAASGVDVNLDAADQAWAYHRRHPGRPFGLRVNPGKGAGSHEPCTTGGTDSKLGIPWGEVPGLIQGLREAGAALVGLHCHTGSGGLEVEHFVSVAAQMSDLADQSGPLQWLSLGGGLGVPHHPDDKPFDLARYGEAIRAAVRPERELRLEPGQAFVAAAGVLLATVVSTKQHPDGSRFALTDSSFNHYLGTSLYGSYHEIHVDLSAQHLAERDDAVQNVVGHLCNTGDVFAKARELPELKLDDRLLIATCGAYGLSRAANYNSRPIPAEVWVEGEQHRLIRRRQRVEDLSQWYVD